MSNLLALKGNSDYRLFTRTLFCKECYKHNRPRKEDFFLVFRGTHQDFDPRVNHLSSIKTTRGFTPHLIVVPDPFGAPDNTVDLIVVCMMQRCGIFIDFSVVKNGKYPIKSLASRTITVTEHQLHALVLAWTNTGYELF